jgi:hypothetical protein
VETERPKTDHGGEQPGTTNNVVPFPRDWLGPREELVPFGNGAACEAEPGPAGPGAEAFWGGECDPWHAVLAAPAASAPIAGRRLQPLAGRLAIGGLVVTVLAMAVLGRIVGVPTGGSGPTVGSDVAAAGFFDLAQLRGAVGTPTIESSKRSVHSAIRTPARSAAHARHRRRPATRTSGTNSAPPASSSATTVAAAPTTTSQPVSSATSSQSVSSATSSSTASQPTETSSAPTHSSASSHTATVRPGPVGPGAPFGPGQVK